ncbi:MAG: hypothetical protein ABW047_16470 [Nitrospiraceae bacterium]
MPKSSRSDHDKDDTSVLFIRGVPRTMQAKLKAMAALNQQSLAQYVTDLFEEHLEELDRKGMLPRGK